MEEAELDIHSAAVHLKDLSESKEGCLLQIHAQGPWGDIWPALLLDQSPKVPVHVLGFACHEPEGSWKDTAVASKHKENVELEREIVNSRVIILANNCKPA